MDISIDGDGGVSVSLPEDIIFDVLARLPVKTLCRLQCVSKGWRALISDPAFAATHRSRAAAAPVGGGLRVIDTASGDVLRVVEDVRRPDLVRTRLDLVFIAQGDLGACWVIDSETGGVLTFNREKRGEYPRTNYNRTMNTVGVGVHNRHYSFGRECHHSFARATPSGTYKVLHLRCMRLANGDGADICQIATIGNGVAVEPPTWRQRPEPPILTCHCYTCVAGVDGVLHYFMDRRRRTPNDHGRRCPGYPRIASFDLESEEWRKMVIDAPRTGWSDEVSGCHMRLAELKGTLSVLQTILMLNYYLTASGKDNQDLCGAHLQFYNTSTGALTNLMEMGQGFIGSSLTLYTRNFLA
ncbi:hypothetical protein PAHAL_1G246700 [Panicum hallii]|uniref:F-box domain-containing protein n=1 Tax=Panicum hallii TaxID=206008 RepID=A0A2T8KW91_9POAL|nr:hypothetical protein PAHAL_1G246700 [Panicum hallii]